MHLTGFSFIYWFPSKKNTSIQCFNFILVLCALDFKINNFNFVIILSVKGTKPEIQGTSQVHRPQCITGTYFINHKRMKGKVDFCRILTQSIMMDKIPLSILPSMLTILPVHCLSYFLL